MMPRMSIDNRADLRPIGAVVELGFPPDLSSTDSHSGHAHVWRYLVEEHVQVEPLYNGGKEWAEALKPVERICKEDA